MMVLDILRKVFFPPTQAREALPQTGEEARRVIEAAFLHVNGIPEGMKKVNREGSIFVLS